ncbi:MAG: hypothetical protein M1813_008743 [Trichoglossum hirsutum]|nr:MAG: hypothetical protein M1813_008743 [Trichoglossum hirsutum]
MASFYAASASNRSYITVETSSVATFETAPEQVSLYIKSLRRRRLISPPSKELNWSGRGQHVEFGKSESLPLKERPRPIGKGSTAIVDVVLCRRIRLARKSMICNRNLTLATILHEVEHLQQLRHCHIVQLVGTYLQGRTLAILQYPVADFNLTDFLEYVAEGNADGGVRASLTLHCGCLVHALDYIHANTIKHMDIKPRNILVKQLVGKNNEYRFYITDFGISRSFTEQSQTDGPTARTPMYCSPEVYNGDLRGRQADVFSMGCVLLEMWTVWAGQSLDSFAEFRSNEGDESYRTNLPRVLQWIDLLGEEVLKLGPTDRRCANGQDRSPVGLGAIRRMLDEDPRGRPSAKELKDAFPSNMCCDSGPEPYESESQELTKAAWAGNETAMRQLLENGAEMETRDGDGRTALHLAARGGHDAVVRLLVGGGANLAARDGLGWTALHEAAASGHETVVRLLAEKGADVRAVERGGRTALHEAAEGGHEVAARLLVENGADVAAKNRLGRTALHEAAKSGHQAVVRLLVENGADITAKDYLGWTALNRAAEGGHEAVARLPVGGGATSSGRAAVVQPSMENGADVAVVVVDGKTAMQRTALREEARERQTLEWRENALGREHPDTLRSISNLAEVFNSQGKCGEAEEMNPQTLMLRERMLGREHPDTLVSMSNFAMVLNSQGKYDEAEEMNRRTLKLREKLLGKEHPDTLVSMSNIAMVLNSQGKYGEAEEMNQRTLKLREKVLWKEHPDTLVSMSNFAMVLNSQGKYDEAEEMNRRTLKLREKFLGKEHPDTLVSMNNIAMVLNSQGKYDEAEEINRRTLKLRGKVLGKEHPDTLVSMSNFAMVLNTQGKYDKAENINQRTIKLREKVLGKEHPDTLVSMSNIAMVLNTQGKYGEAEEMNQRTLKLREKVLGKEHPDTLMSMSNIAMVLNSRGKYDEAEEMNRRTLELREKVLGGEHPDTLVSRSSWQKCLTAKAEEVNWRTLELRGGDAGEGALGHAGEHGQLAEVLNSQGRCGKAEKLREKMLGKMHSDTLVSTNGSQSRNGATQLGQVGRG